MSEYKGYEVLELSEEEIEEYKADLLDFDYLLLNQYLVIKDQNGEVIDRKIKKANGLEPIYYHKIHAIDGNISPRNLEQELAFDLLQDPQTPIKLICGPYGSGKDYCMLGQAFELIQKGLYDRLVYVRNNVEVRDSEKLGALPGDQNDKLMPYLMVMADHLGGVSNLKGYINDAIIEPVHLGYLRGRDLKRSIIYCTEAQNLTVDHMKLLIGRVGEGSALWLNGDFKAQVDKPIFYKESGVKTLIERLAGNPYFGYVQLVKSERSPVAALADLLD